MTIKNLEFRCFSWESLPRVVLSCICAFMLSSVRRILTPLPVGRGTERFRLMASSLAVFSLGAGTTVHALQPPGGQDAPTHLPARARAFADPENCLSCHKFRGLSRLEPESDEVRLFFNDAEYHANLQGPHARLRCTACHVREEVAVIPHQVRTPVDCTRTCHITTATGFETRFSHKSIAEVLDQSSHGAAALANLPFDPPLLRAGQSNCLYCHDEPVFRVPEGIQSGRFLGGRGSLGSGLVGCDPATRCDTCHNETLPLDTEYFTRHVLGRLQPTRPLRQLAQICAVCHSDREVIAQQGGHDAVASYLHSFHGKAALLGSTETATCIDCHASPSGDVHLMLAASHPQSSVHETQLPHSCRTTECHPGAAPGISAASVHLNIDPTVRSVEFYVAAGFIILTAGVMVVYFLMIHLELLNTIFRRWDRDHAQRVELARKVNAHPIGRQLLTRMSVHERIQHWVLVVLFLLLVISGMPLKFADREWASWMIELQGGLPNARWIHRAAGTLSIVAFFYHIGYIAFAVAEKIRRLRAEGSQEPVWRIALRGRMVATRDDLRHFLHLFQFLLFWRKHRPKFPHFNFMQKFEHWAVFWGMPILGLSGLVLWQAAYVVEYATGRALNFAYIIHTYEAYLAFVHVAVVHMFGAIFAPSVFPMSFGTFTGQIPPEEVAEGHAGQLDEVAERLGLHADPPPPPEWTAGYLTRQIMMRLYSAALLGLIFIISIASLRYLGNQLLATKVAPVEIVGVPTRLSSEALLASATPTARPQDATQIRGPLAHYHKIPPWFNNDIGNNCTTSGCHSPLPHGNRVELRAFANMHATFLDCMVCHSFSAGQAESAQWFDLTDRRPRIAPAILRLSSELERLYPELASERVDLPGRRAINAKLIDLLTEASADSRQHAQLQTWLLRLQTVNIDSRLWQSVIEDMYTPVSLHVHGEYQAKIALWEGDRMLGRPTQAQLDAAETFRNQGDRLSDKQRQALLDTVHQGVSPVGVLCTPCHSAEPTLMDFGDLGYSPARVRELQGSVIINQVLSIESGQPFFMSQVLEGSRGD